METLNDIDYQNREGQSFDDSSYPDYRSAEEEERSGKRDVSGVTEWKELFPDLQSYIDALRKMDHPLHAEARTIRDNRLVMKGQVVLDDRTEESLRRNELLREQESNPFKK